MDKIKDLDIEYIAPSHGLIHKKPKQILGLYDEWSSDAVKNEVIIPYVSMHGSTKVMVDFLTCKLIEKGIRVKLFNLVDFDSGEFAMALVDAATIIFATPAVLVGPHPKAIYAAFLSNAFRPKAKFVSIIGSFGWGCKIVEILSSMITNIKAEIVDPVVIKGYPKECDFKKLEQLANAIVDRHVEINIKTL
jgi:flavorubredoxin